MARKRLIVLISASLIKSRNAMCVGVVTICETVVGVDTISVVLTRLATFGRFVCLKFFLAICNVSGSFVSGNG